MEICKEQKHNYLYLQVHIWYVQEKRCTNSNEELMKLPKEQKLIKILTIIHAGRENGFVCGANLSCKSKLLIGDFHIEINYYNLREQVEKKLINELLTKQCNCYG